MSIDLQTAVKHNVTLVSGEALVNPMKNDGGFDPTRTFRKIVRGCLTICVLVVLTPAAWLVWESERPLNEHETWLVGTWSIGNVEGVDRNDEELPGVPCGMPLFVYRFLPNRTFHARRINYFVGGMTYSGPVKLSDVEGKWIIRGNRIILTHPRTSGSWPTQLRNAVGDLKQGLNPLSSLNNRLGHEMHVIEWRRNGVLFSNDRDRIFDENSITMKMYPSRGDLFELPPSMFQATFPLMLSDGRNEY